MGKPSQSQALSLAELRREIDRIDEAMHRLLMERGEIIDRLIATKQTQETGSAFRPAREADMMRRLVDRHKGILPLETAESIWRVIISTFTYVQAPFSVHADLSAGEAAMRDSARFHFGFTVPFVPHADAASVVAAVSDSRGDLGLVPAFGTAGTGAWWSALEADAMVRDVEVWSVRLAGWSTAAAEAVASLAEVIAVPDRGFDSAALLISVPQGGRIERVTDTLVKAGASVRTAALVGSHATRYRVSTEGTRPVSTGP
jgi:chorismate mutase